MKRLLLIAAVFTAQLVAGCSSPCDVLADQCAKCKDAATKQACDTTVSTYRAVPVSGSTACQAVLDGKTYASCQ